MGLTNSIWEMQLVDRIAPFGLAVCHGLSSSVGSTSKLRRSPWNFMEMTGKKDEVHGIDREKG